MSAVRRDWLRWVLAAAAMFGLGSVLWQAQQDRDHLAGRLTEEIEDQDDLEGGVAVLQGQIEALGGEPAVEVEQTPEGPEVVDVDQEGPQGERGEQGPAPSDEQVAEAVDRYCAINGCAGPQGPSPSPLEVAQAVASYCNARGDCAGPAGATGESGPTGPAGPAPSDAQIAAAVEGYCSAHDGCRGPQGETGATGATGPQGAPGPACPEGAQPVTWTVDEPRSAVIGLDPGTYVVCRAA